MRAFYTARARADPGRYTRQRRERFHAEVRKAKRAFWQKRIDNAAQDRDIYSVISWHKLRTPLRSPPIRVGDSFAVDPVEKATALRSAVLERFSSADNLPGDPLEGWSNEEASIP